MTQKETLDSMSIHGLDNAKFRLEKAYQHLSVEYSQTRIGDKYVKINYIPKSAPQTQTASWVKIFYKDDRDLKKISKELDLEEFENDNELYYQFLNLNGI